MFEINFFINEGQQYLFSTFKINNNLDENSDLDIKLLKFIDQYQNKINNIYYTEKLDEIEYDISNILEIEGIQYFEITALKKSIISKLIYYLKFLLLIQFMLIKLIFQETKELTTMFLEESLNYLKVIQ